MARRRVSRTTCSSASCGGDDGEGDRVTETRAVVGREGGRDRLRPAVRRDRRADQPDGPQGSPAEMAAGNFDTVVADAIAQVEAGAQMLDVNAGIPLADEPAILAAHRRARAVDHRRAALDRLLDRRGARGGARRLPGQGARQLGDRRGRADGARAAARRAARRRRRRDHERRDGNQRGPRRAVRGRARRSSRAPRTTASRARTSSSTRS